MRMVKKRRIILFYHTRMKAMFLLYGHHHNITGAREKLAIIARNNLELFEQLLTIM